MDVEYLQSYVTLSLLAGTSLSQSSHAWLELPDHEDFVLIIDVSKADSGLRLYLESNHSREESTFLPLNAGGTAMTAGTTVVPSHAEYSFTPVAHYLRWRIAATSNGSATFRVIAAGYTLKS